MHDAFSCVAAFSHEWPIVDATECELYTPLQHERNKVEQEWHLDFKK